MVLDGTLVFWEWGRPPSSGVEVEDIEFSTKATTARATTDIVF